MGKQKKSQGRCIRRMNEILNKKKKKKEIQTVVIALSLNTTLIVDIATEIKCKILCEVTTYLKKVE